MKPKIINTIRGQVYEQLKQAICDGDYKPGQWLQEKELAEQFSVSRSPVREALKQLAADGLVTEIPNKGIFVRKFTPKDIEEIFDLRVMLESYAIQKVVEHLSTDGESIKQELTSCLQTLEKTYRQNDLSLYTDADTALHEKIIQLSGNDFLGIVYERVHIMIQQFRSYSLTDSSRYEASMTEHEEIVNNILSGQTQEAIKINQAHLELAKEQIMIYLEKKELEE
ncbi:MAG: GntR family transcriptional regulator [Lachnospiraceae bacterium]|nr:GntR family transcriptional regulator [Lachnospiraceae bacterium]